MKNLKQLLSNLLKDETRKDLIEYALVACLIALATLATRNTSGNDIAKALTAIEAKLSAVL